MSDCSYRNNSLFLTNLVLPYTSTGFDTCCPVEKACVAVSCIYLFVSKGHLKFN